MDNSSYQSRIDLTELSEGIDNIKKCMAEVIVGQDSTLDLMISALLANGHVLIEGVPGLAKTLIARSLAASVGVDFQRIQFTPDLLPTDVLGTSIFNPKTMEFTFNQGPVFSNFVLIDEINRAPAKTQSALFEVMEERTVTADGTTFTMSSPFFVMATQNPVDHEGTYRLPEAQVDRFLFKLELQYPQRDEEVTILESHHKKPAFEALKKLKKAVPKSFVQKAQGIISQVHVESALIGYITDLTSKTRNHGMISLGASPRASLALLDGAKAFAAISGRDFITPEDIRHVALPALRHRIILSAEAEMEGLKPDDILRQIIDSVKIPR